MKENQMDAVLFAKQYLERLSHLFTIIDTTAIGKIIEILEKVNTNNASVYVIGNGGSASTASHIVNDIGVGLRRRGLLNINIQALADNTASCTAIANDLGYDDIFFMQLVGLLKKDDVLISISCSGSSPNIIKASTYAKSMGATLIGVSGFDGGILKDISDISFHVPTEKGDYGLVEDMHMILDHIIYSYYIEKNKNILENH